MDTSDAEEDSVTMEVDNCMVSMDTRDEGMSEPHAESWKEMSSECNTDDAQDFRSPPDASSLPPRSAPPACLPAQGDRVWSLPQGTCRKRTLRPGEGLAGPRPETFSMVTVQLDPVSVTMDTAQLGYPVGRWQLPLGEGSEPLSVLLDRAIMSMKKGEVAEVSLSGPAANVPGGGDAVVHVALHDFTEAVPPWRLTPEEKTAAAQSHKERGGALFKSGNIPAAFSHFQSAARLLLSLPLLGLAEEGDGAADTGRQRLLCQCALNLAACQLKTGHHPHVVANCSLALDIDPANVKALYRRASAYTSLGDLRRARDDLEQGLRLEPTNRAVMELMHRVNAQLTASQTHLAQGLCKMFS